MNKVRLELYECVFQAYSVTNEFGTGSRTVPEQSIFVLASSVRDAIDLLAPQDNETPELVCIRRIHGVIVQSGETKYPIKRLGV